MKTFAILTLLLAGCSEPHSDPSQIRSESDITRTHSVVLGAGLATGIERYLQSIAVDYELDEELQFLKNNISFYSGRIHYIRAADYVVVKDNGHETDRSTYIITETEQSPGREIIEPVRVPWRWIVQGLADQLPAETRLVTLVDQKEQGPWTYWLFVKQPIPEGISLADLENELDSRQGIHDGELITAIGQLRFSDKVMLVTMEGDSN